MGDKAEETSQEIEHSIQKRWNVEKENQMISPRDPVSE